MVLAGLHARVPSYALRIGDEHVHRDAGIVVQVVAGLAFPGDTDLIEEFPDRVVVVILGDVRHDGAAVPLRVQRFGDRLHARLVPAAVANQDDVLEAVHLQAVRDVGEHRLKRLLAHADGADRDHVRALRLDRPFRDQRDDRCAQRVPELAGDGVAVRAQHVVVFAERQPRSVRLDAAGRDDDGRLAGLHRVANVHPRQLFEPDRVGRPQRIRRVDAVVRVRGALTAAGAARIRWLSPAAPALTCRLPRRLGRQRRCQKDGDAERADDALHEVAPPK